MSAGAPVRTCIGCRARRPQAELVRIVARDGQLIAGRGEPGRGAWLCRSTRLTCFDTAVKARRWARALRCELDPAAWPALRIELEGPLGGP